MHWKKRFIEVVTQIWPGIYVNKSILYTFPLFYFRECNPLMTPKNIWTGNLKWKSNFNILKQIWYCFHKCTEAVLTNFCAKILDLWYVRSTKAMSYLFFSSTIFHCIFRLKLYAWSCMKYNGTSTANLCNSESGSF